MSSLCAARREGAYEEQGRATDGGGGNTGTVDAKKSRLSQIKTRYRAEAEIDVYLTAFLAYSCPLFPESG